jgi:hypothetical protein
VRWIHLKVVFVIAAEEEVVCAAFAAKKSAYKKVRTIIAHVSVTDWTFSKYFHLFRCRTRTANSWAGHKAYYSVSAPKGAAELNSTIAAIIIATRLTLPL